MSAFDAIEADLHRETKGVFGKYADRVLHLERLRPWLIGLGAFAALVTALGRIEAFGDIGLVLTIGGLLVAFLCAAVVAAFDFKKLELGAHLTKMEETANQAIETGRGLEQAGQALESELQKARRSAEILDQRRRERLQAIEQMLQAVEAGLLKSRNEKALKNTAAAMLKLSINAIRYAVGYQANEFFTVTIFRREGDEMVRIAAEWTDPALAGKDGRAWKKGRGYTGGAWHKAEGNPNGDVIISDTRPKHVAREYPVDNRDPDREALYKSVAAIPILIRNNNEVWGVVTATSDRVGMFAQEGPGLQNVETIRDIARIAALLAGLNGRRGAARPQPPSP